MKDEIKKLRHSDYPDKSPDPLSLVAPVDDRRRDHR